MLFSFVSAVVTWKCTISCSIRTTWWSSGYLTESCKREWETYVAGQTGCRWFFNFSSKRTSFTSSSSRACEDNIASMVHLVRSHFWLFAPEFYIIRSQEKSYNVKFPKANKLWVWFQLITWFEYHIHVEIRRSEVRIPVLVQVFLLRSYKSIFKLLFVGINLSSIVNAYHGRYDPMTYCLGA